MYTTKGVVPILSATDYSGKSQGGMFVDAVGIDLSLSQVKSVFYRLSDLGLIIKLF
ncbi:MAG: hypothetical protein JZU53_18415 [Paludibacter sp.]|nr:hypothetical protein [Paludibacter sp.]